jgi:hypothetical protein
MRYLQTDFKASPVYPVLVTGGEWLFSIMCFGLSVIATSIHSAACLAATLAERISGKGGRGYKFFYNMTNYQLGRIAVGIPAATSSFSKQVAKENELELAAHRVAESHQPAEGTRAEDDGVRYPEQDETDLSDEDESGNTDSIKDTQRD